MHTADTYTQLHNLTLTLSLQTTHIIVVVHHAMIRVYEKIDVNVTRTKERFNPFVTKGLNVFINNY